MNALKDAQHTVVEDGPNRVRHRPRQGVRR